MNKTSKVEIAPKNKLWLPDPHRWDSESIPDGLPIEQVELLVKERIIALTQVPISYLPNNKEELNALLNKLGAEKDLAKLIERWIKEIKAIPNPAGAKIHERSICQNIIKFCKNPVVVNEAAFMLIKLYAKTPPVRSSIGYDLGEITNPVTLEAVISNLIHGYYALTKEHIKHIMLAAAARGDLTAVMRVAVKISGASEHLSSLYKVVVRSRAYNIMKWLIEMGVSPQKNKKCTIPPLAMVDALKLSRQWLVDVAGCSEPVVELSYKVIGLIQKTGQTIPDHIIVEPTSLLEVICKLLPDVELADEAIKIGAATINEDADDNTDECMPMLYACQNHNKRLVKYLYSRGSYIKPFYAINENKDFTEWCYNRYRKAFSKKTDSILYLKLLEHGYTNILILELLRAETPPTLRLSQRALVKDMRNIKLISAVGVLIYNLGDKHNTRAYRWFKRRSYVSQYIPREHTETLLNLV